ncbi:SigE family RNA polymerase sigma factor [Frankia sp. R82]|uniref:SigE family RNA polymerase sigma factor n=1 Tax=Frankia sp. R82 TaxID=2950553 RepID=UPI00204399E7|nr:SigE family RNA polymerase sigma factor [Frankia sp. R82]MCM3882424.1 SigE family RNA polymerase sigma factor [Frankia sp. R82]
MEAVAADDDDHPHDQAEFRAFFERHHRELSRFAYLLSGDHDAADDITADALTAAWTRWDRVQAAEFPLAYVRRIVANLAADRVRRVVRERRGLLALGEQAEGSTPGPDVPAVVDLRSALMSLPPGKRACVVLRYAFDLSETETARTLGISVGTVKSQTARGVADLERLLQGSPAAPAASTSRDLRSPDTSGRAAGRNTTSRRSGGQVPPHSGGARAGSLRPDRRRPGSSGSPAGPDPSAFTAEPAELVVGLSLDQPSSQEHLVQVGPSSQVRSHIPTQDDHPTERIRRRLRPERRNRPEPARNWPGWRVGEA